ncbi:class I SAM-dependent methyltransferase [Rhodopila sp.]|uniref:class I SAM-dependent methyltransferase n=1 Tax=Rhodopila sp. TaxID=2480087 RepID=UPI003D0EEA89
MVRQYESVRFADVHKQIMHLIPKSPSHILDIGAGTGRDAAGFAAMGHLVTAVEPTAELRRRATVLHACPRVEWLDDCLPELAALSGRDAAFDVVMLTAVWMHLDEQQRRCAMPRVAALIRPKGVMMLSLRHGPVPVGRRMFNVTPAETARLARAEGLTCVQYVADEDSLLKRPGVTWDRLAFIKAANSGTGDPGAGGLG